MSVCPFSRSCRFVFFCFLASVRGFRAFSDIRLGRRSRAAQFAMRGGGGHAGVPAAQLGGAAAPPRRPAGEQPGGRRRHEATKRRAPGEMPRTPAGAWDWRGGWRKSVRHLRHLLVFAGASNHSSASERCRISSIQKGAGGIQFCLKRSLSELRVLEGHGSKWESDHRTDMDVILAPPGAFRHVCQGETGWRSFLYLGKGNEGGNGRIYFDTDQECALGSRSMPSAVWVNQDHCAVDSSLELRGARIPSGCRAQACQSLAISTFPAAPSDSQLARNRISFLQTKKAKKTRTQTIPP